MEMIKVSAWQAHRQGMCAKDCQYCEDQRFSGQSMTRLVVMAEKTSARVNRGKNRAGRSRIRRSI